MEINSELIESNGYSIPSIIIYPEAEKGTVIIIHGYGGSKEEQLGLGWRIAEGGYKTCLIDLPGHGESKDDFNGAIDLYVAAAIDSFNNEKNLTVIGHSVGGRLAFVSKAKQAIGISPTLIRDFSPETKAILKNIRAYKVKQSSENFLWELQQTLPIPDLSQKEHFAIIFGSRDVPEIANYCRNLHSQFSNIYEIEKALHSDIFYNEETFAIIIKLLDKWSMQSEQ